MQYPGDYLDVLKIGIPKLLESADVMKEQVTGIQVGFVSCGVMPVDKEGTPLCFYEKFKNWPYTYIELWKHQGIHHEAERFHKAVKEWNESFVKHDGEKMSLKKIVAKAMQIPHEDERLYDAVDRFIETEDWIVLILTGQEKKSLCQTGYLSKIGAKLTGLGEGTAVLLSSGSNDSRGRREGL